jgi:O-methyltransferase involved in polyketide biosynthesis
MQEAAERWRSHGFDLDFGELVYLGDRNEAGAYIEDRGWKLSRRSVNDLLADNGRPTLPEGDEDVARFGELQYVRAILAA